MNPAKQPTHHQVQPLLSIKEVADILGVSRQTVYTYIYLEHLPSITVAGIRRIRPESLARWLSERESTNGRKA